MNFLYTCVCICMHTYIHICSMHCVSIRTFGARRHRRLQHPAAHCTLRHTTTQLLCHINDTTRQSTTPPHSCHINDTTTLCHINDTPQHSCSTTSTTHTSAENAGTQERTTKKKTHTLSNSLARDAVGMFIRERKNIKGGKTRYTPGQSFGGRRRWRVREQTRRSESAEYT